VTLFTRTVEVTGHNAVALDLLGFGLAKQERLDEAVPLYRESLRLMPHNPMGHYNLGLALESLHRTPEAADSFAETVRQQPDYGEARYSLGAALLELNRLTEARKELEAAILLPLDNAYAAQAHFRLGLIGAYQGDLLRARDGFSAALRLQPGMNEARINLDRALAQLRAQ
jgi:tetratricopeptide (TPR) repeat protein